VTTAVDHPLAQPWTLQEVMELPEDGLRYELIDGVLIVNPPPVPKHQSVSLELYVLLRAAANAAATPTRVLEGVGIAMPDDNLLIPDLVVVAADAPSYHQPLLDPYDVQLAVEVVSPGSRRRDRSVKPYMYAEAGIPHFWRIETANYRGRSKELPVVVRHELVGLAEYQVVAEVGAGQTLQVDEPFPVSFDPAALLD
jgi:Uma2 family endonuclease